MEIPSSSKGKDAYRYVYSCQLVKAGLQIKICELEGIFRDSNDPIRKLEQVVVEATIYCDGRAMGFPVTTSFKPPSDDKRSKIMQVWNEWLTLPVKYSDLSRDSFIHFSIWELDIDDAFPLPLSNTNCTTLYDNTYVWLLVSSSYLFQVPFPKKLVCQNSMRLFSKRGVLKSGIIDLQMRLSAEPDPFIQNGQDWRFSNEAGDDHLLLLLKQVERQKRDIIDSVVWLDQITKPVIERIRENRKNSHRNVFLVVEMATLVYDSRQFDVVYYEQDAADSRVISASTIQSKVSGDPELGLQNLCEEMHMALTRKPLERQSLQYEVAKKLKPSLQIKEKLEQIITQAPSAVLTPEQKDLVWKFRFYLKQDRRALNKFLKGINWDKEAQVEEALSLINDWSPIEVEDALELLSPAFTHPGVREYAVNRLFHSATPEQVHLYLPQLVQALKYEPYKEQDVTKVIQPDPQIVTTDNTEIIEKMEDIEIQKPRDDLASFLIKYCTGYVRVANFLFWHLKVEEEVTRGDPAMTAMYKHLKQRLLNELNETSIDGRKHANSLEAQVHFLEHLKLITKEAKEKAQRRDIRETALRTKLSKDARMANLGGLILPLDPSVKLERVIPDAAQLFSSAMMPAKITFKAKQEQGNQVIDVEYSLIYKQGDDLRQDQLVIQMIRLMDTLLKKSQLDLKLTPYAVLATGVDEGFVQFVKAKPLRNIMKKYSAYKNDAIREAMREVRPDANGPYGIEADVIDRYVRSVAGYCVVCYVLGVGDRHLDNLLLCEDGRLFHVDFGYILGRDPKLMPPPMKLTVAMVQAMGGLNGKEFKDFCLYCDAAYQILRRNANVILNLFALMLDAGIPNIEEERDKAVLKVEHRLQLNLADQEVFNFMIGLILQSNKATMPEIIDIFHDWNQRLSW